MKINQYNGPSLYKAYEIQTRKKEQRENTPVSVNHLAGDSLELSDNVKELQYYKAQLAKLPSIREALVDGLKKNIQEQNYQVDPEKIADKMAGERLLDKLTIKNNY